MAGKEDLHEQVDRVVAGMKRHAAYAQEFLKSVSGRRFRNPETGNEVFFQSLPPAEQAKIYSEWGTQERVRRQEESRERAGIEPAPPGAAKRPKSEEIPYGGFGKPPSLRGERSKKARDLVAAAARQLGID